MQNECVITDPLWFDYPFPAYSALRRFIPLLLLFRNVTRNWERLAQHPKRPTKIKLETSAGDSRPMSNHTAHMPERRPPNRRKTNRQTKHTQKTERTTAQRLKNAPLCGNTLNQMQAQRFISKLARAQQQQHRRWWQQQHMKASRYRVRGATVTAPVAYSIENRLYDGKTKRNETKRMRVPHQR